MKRKLRLKYGKYAKTEKKNVNPFGGVLMKKNKQPLLCNSKYDRQDKEERQVRQEFWGCLRNEHVGVLLSTTAE